MKPTCPVCRAALRLFLENSQWGCDACRQIYPATISRVRAQAWTDGPAAKPSAYIGDFWVEHDRVVFAATAKVGARFWGFLGAMAVGTVAGRGAARAIGRVAFDFQPRLDHPGSLSIPMGEIIAVLQVRSSTWELRLAP
jgi:hypothetical protein